MCTGKACAVCVHQYGIVLGKYTHVIMKEYYRAMFKIINSVSSFVIKFEKGLKHRAITYFIHYKIGLSSF
jgi:hypothetical protein